MLEVAPNPLAERTTTHLQKLVDPAAAMTKRTARIVDKTAMMTMIAVIGAITGGEIAPLPLTEGTTGTGIETGKEKGRGRERTPGTDPSQTETQEGQSPRLGSDEIF